MANETIKAYIQLKKDELQKHSDFWAYVNELSNTVGLRFETYQELQAKVSSKMAQCERSIQDHEKLLTNANN